MSTELAGTPTTTASPTPLLQQTTITSAKKNATSRRIEVENLAVDLQKQLGSNWDNYQATISAFLVGRLSRKELTNVLNNLLTNSKMVRMHNQLLLANLANAFRDGPNSASAKSGFGANSSNKKKKDGRVKVSSQYEKLKKDIMALPIRERHRIKSITRESGKQKMANSALTLTRQALLPKVPYVSDKEKIVTGNTVEWTQDITHSLQALLSTESFSLPDNENLKTRMLGIAREHGLTGAIQKEALDIATIGLETYLRNIIESAIDTVRYRKLKHTENDLIEDTERPRKRQKKVILTTEDMADTFSVFPYLVEESGPLYRLHSIQLNDDSYVETKNPIESLLKPRSEVAKADPILEKLTAQKKLDEAAKKNESDKPTEEKPIKVEDDKSNNIITNTNATTTTTTNTATNTPTTSAATNNTDPTKTTTTTTTPSSSNSNGDSAQQQQTTASAASAATTNANVGTKDELNWLIHDIISAQ